MGPRVTSTIRASVRDARIADGSLSSWVSTMIWRSRAEFGQHLQEAVDLGWIHGLDRIVEH